MEKYGFVYIWYDKKRKMYYVGCHWGTETDGYICSSRRMRDVYRRRDPDFKRRIIKRVTTNRLDLLEEEHKWLSFIPKEELGKKYYNLRNHKFHSEETKVIIREKRKLQAPTYGMKGKIPWNKGKTGVKINSAETRQKLSRKLKGRITNPNCVKEYNFIDPDGNHVKIHNMDKFIRENTHLNFNPKSLRLVHEGKRNSCYGWTKWNGKDETVVHK